MRMRLDNKVVVITGASEGIGKELALRLAKEACKLVLLARNTNALQEVSLQAKEAGAIDVKIYPCDIRQTDILGSQIQQIEKDFGYIDILINNAGVWQKVMPLDQIAPEIINEVIATNLLGVIHTTRLILPILRKRDEAAIINIISKSGIIAQEGQCIYTASKYGVRGFTEVLKADLKGSTIRVAGVYQSGTNTKMFEKAGESFSTENFTNPADLADIIAYMLTRPANISIHDVYVEK